MGAAAHVGAVEVELEDLVLGQVRFEPEREERLLDLALERALVRQEEVLGELLGDRGAALHDAAAAGVHGDRAEGADRVDAPVLVEAAVLGREGGLDEIVRKLFELVGIVEPDAAAADLLAVAVEEGDRELLRLQPVLVGLLEGRDGEREHDDAAGRAEGGRFARQVQNNAERAAGAELVDGPGIGFPQVREAAPALEQGRVQPGVEPERRALKARPETGGGGWGHDDPCWTALFGCDGAILSAFAGSDEGQV